METKKQKTFPVYKKLNIHQFIKSYNKNIRNTE